MKPGAPEKPGAPRILVHRQNLVHRTVGHASDQTLPSTHNPTNFGYGSYGVQGLNPIREKEKKPKTHKNENTQNIHTCITWAWSEGGGRCGLQGWEEGAGRVRYRSREPFCVEWRVPLA